MYPDIVKQFRINFKIGVNKIAHHRRQYIGDKNFLVLLAIWVGILSGFAAIVLKYSVHWIQHLLEGGFNVRYENYLYLLYPLFGILLSVLYLRIFHYKKVFDKGLSSIIYSISRKGATVERHKTFSHVITSALTVGFGGSVGLEAPIAVTGSAIGANTAKDLLLNKQSRTLLLACGAASGIAAIFNSPIAGVIFAFEVLLTEVSIPAFIPLLIASASGAVVSKLFYSEQLFFLTTNDWDLNALPFYLLLGAFCGLISAYMVRMSTGIEHYFNKRKNPWQKAIYGGILIGLLLFFLPALYGEGFHTITNLMAGNAHMLLDRSLFYAYNDNAWVILMVVGIVILLKVFASAITIGAGGNGGIFGPALFTGALSGFLFSRFINLTRLTQLNEQNFIAVAMCGLISGALHAPLTGIFLIAEITGGYVLIIPLMIVSSMAYFVTRYFEPNSIYKKTLIERGFITDDKDIALLRSVPIEKLIETDYSPVYANQTLRELLDIVSHSKRNTFPVVDHTGVLLGILTLDELKEVMFNTEHYDTMTVTDLMILPAAVVQTNETIETLMELFETTQIWTIPVVAGSRYIGFITKSNLLQHYRQQFISDEQTKLN